MFKELAEDGSAILICPDCGVEFKAAYSETDDPELRKIFRECYAEVRCPACSQKQQAVAAGIAAAKRAAEQNVRMDYLKNSIDERMRKTRIPENFLRLTAPPVRMTAEWIYRNRDNSFLLSGETGTGKTTGISFVIRYLLLHKEMNIRYRTWQMLNAEFVEAKTCRDDGEARFLNRIDQLDYLIVDEMVGKRGDGKLNSSGQALLFNLVDGVYSGARKTRIWLLGNFYSGAIDRMVDDPQPMRRRIQAAFKLGWCEPGKPVDESVRIFEENLPKPEESPEK